MDEGTSNQIDPSCVSIYLWWSVNSFFVFQISLFNCPSPSDLVTNVSFEGVR